MARIKIEDLPVLEELKSEELKGIFGGQEPIIAIAAGGKALGGKALGGSALGGSAIGGSALGGSALGGQFTQIPPQWQK